MAHRDALNDRAVKRRIAATAATAALAISGPAVAARPASARTTSPARAGGDPVSRVAHADQSWAASSLEVSRMTEMATHRQRLATALAAEVGGSAAAARIERGLEAAEAEIGSAYSRGERPQFADGLPVALVESSGLSEAKLAEAFESMSRHALQRRRGTRA
jgi:hypothetical protein